MKIVIITFFVILNNIVYAQLFSFTGQVKDKLTGEKLSFANIRVLGTTTGTAANSEGLFELRLKKGDYTFITSFIGYKSDTTKIILNENKFLEIYLEPIPIKLSDITILPGKNPALEIVEKAINYRKERDSKLHSYIFDAYTKSLIKTTKDIIASDKSIGISIGEKDTGKIKITGIIENQSRGYFKKPNKYKDIIVARKQSANTPPTINILTGGRTIQNFYTNDIRFFNRPLPSPISDEALNFYYYIIKDTLFIDNYKVYKIYFEPIDTLNPGLYGDIYLIDSLFALIKIDAHINDAANPGKLFDKINIFQQFTSFDNNIYMPVDYRIFVEGNILGLLKLGFELNTIFYNYQINSHIDDEIFDMALISVLPDADKKDSSYWKSNQTIPNTFDELIAYKKIDSLEHIKRSFWQNNSLFSPRWYFSDIYSITAPLGIYNFNKVSGHQLNFGFFIENELDMRFNSNIKVAYGFSDKKLKTKFFIEYLTGKYRTGKISLNIFNYLTDLFGENIPYNNFTSTFLSLFNKYDFRDYYYSKGWTLNFYNEFFPILGLGIGLISRADNSAHNNSDFSFFYKSRKFNENKLIYETKINAITANFNIDIRKYIENGYYRQRINRGELFSSFNGNVIISNKSLLKSNNEFKLYQLNLSGNIPLFKSTSLVYNIQNIISSGAVPFQMMYALAGNINNVGKNLTFRTIRLGEVFGDKGLIINTQYNFNDELFRLLKIPFLKDSQIGLSCHFNAALISISEESKSILSHSYKEFKHPFYEIGFGIGHLLFPISIELTWKLNYRDKNNFVFGVNVIML